MIEYCQELEDIERRIANIAESLGTLWQAGLNFYRVEDEVQRPPDNQELIVGVCDTRGDTPFKYTTTGWCLDGGKTWIVDNQVCSYVTYWSRMPPYPG